MSLILFQLNAESESPRKVPLKRAKDKSQKKNDYDNSVVKVTQYMYTGTSSKHQLYKVLRINDIIIYFRVWYNLHCIILLRICSGIHNGNSHKPIGCPLKSSVFKYDCSNNKFKCSFNNYLMKMK